MSNELVPMSFNDIEKFADNVVQSRLFAGIDSKDKAIVLMMLCQAEGMNPAQAMQRYDIIQGRPAKKSQAMLQDFVKDGGKLEWVEYSDTRCAANFSHTHYCPTPFMVDWDIERAKKAGLLDKNGGMYQKYPRQMLSSRVISEGVRRINPAVTGGLYTPEEAIDLPPVVNAKPTVAMPKPKEIATDVKPTPIDVKPTTPELHQEPEPTTGHEEPFPCENIDNDDIYAAQYCSVGNAMSAKEGDKINIKGIIIGISSQQVGANKKDKTVYKVQDTQDPILTLNIQKWGLPSTGIEQNMVCIFNRVAVSVFKGTTQYMADSVEPCGI